MVGIYRVLSLTKAYVFQLNPGNHFVQGIERTAVGIQWLLNR